MKSMTETLLWLSREGKIEMTVEQADLGELIKTTQKELAYLLSGKAVTVNLDLEQKNNSRLIFLALTPSIIVLSNLIRNAFQHTQQGHVDIVQRGHEVTITNVESGQLVQKPVRDELGFGLGMKLVEKLTTQFAWPYQIQQTQDGYRVIINFRDNKNKQQD